MTFLSIMYQLSAQMVLTTWGTFVPLQMSKFGGVLRNFMTFQRNIHFSMTFKALKMQNSMTFLVFHDP